MEALVKRIAAAVRPIYENSPFYPGTILDHTTNVSKAAREFALKARVNPYVAEIGGLLHDIGAAKFGRKNHHITGIQEASLILLECECPLFLIGPILSSIFTHRGSQRIAFQTPAAKCVAAADALDHFRDVKTLYEIQIKDGRTAAQARKRVAEHLENDWDKIDPEIQQMLNGTYERAVRELSRIASGNGNSKKDKS